MIELVSMGRTQEVEKFVHPTCRTKRNSDGKTPKMVFTEEHKELVKEGEKWMKETANSCIFVSALTATVGFAASITVPGGNNQNSGFPLFFNNKAFTIFAVSVAFCLFSSVASVLMFLSILSSRYAEEDLLRSLPNRLILVLVTLFISMTSLMTAFGATIYLVFGQRKGWILVPIGLTLLLPVILFESLQFPLLLDMFMSTYDPSIFRKQSSRLLH
ncbi:Ankyrin repeat-containing-like protein [Capsicum annuum]|nr:Ankyrin repeat-containing-like protein [Capsicum annuum]KAF3675782.1 Ankyrin repeat-containing-like protein [Capsicum annuum]